MTVNPNFESSVPVSMYSWVCASTPGVVAHEHGRCHPERRAASLEPVELVEGVGDDPAGAHPQRRVELVVGLVVAVDDEPVGREPGLERDVPLAARGDVEVEPLVGDEARHGPAEERLRRVSDVAGAERAARTPGTAARSASSS